MKTNLHRIVGDLKINSIYHCSVCGNNSIGTTGYFNLNAYGLKDAIDKLSFIEQRSPDMPIGWSYNGEYKCEECNKE